MKMQLSLRKLIGCLAVVGLALLASPSWSEVLVISHSGVSEDTLGKGDIKQVYLGKKTKWPSGEKIVPAVLKKGTTHEAFLKELVKKSPSQFKSFWKKAVFTGTGKPPKGFASEADLVSFVAANEGAIGYVDAATPVEGVKTLQVQ